MLGGGDSCVRVRCGGVCGGGGGVVSGGMDGHQC